MPLHGIAHGAFQVIARDLTLDQVVLDALVKSFNSEFFIILTRQNNYRHIRRLVEDRSEGLRSMAVGKIQIKQYKSRRILSHRGKSIGKPVEAAHVYGGVALDQAQTDQISVSGVIFNQ